MRLIPVLTGNRSLFDNCKNPPTVNPRAYGEQCSLIALQHPTMRLIPVLTGNRPHWRLPLKTLSVNPRAYGEQVTLSALLASITG